MAPAIPGVHRSSPRSVRGLLALLVVAALVPLILVEVDTHTRWRSAHVREDRSHVLERARSAGAGVSAFVQALLREAALLAPLLAGAEIPTGHKENLLARAALESPGVLNWFWVSPEGLVLVPQASEAAPRSVADREYFRTVAAGAESAVSGVLKSRPGERAVFVVARGVRDKGRLLGVLGATVDPAALRPLLSAARLGRESVALLDGRGQLLYAFPELRAAWEERNWRELLPTVRGALGGKELTFVDESPADGATLLYAATPVSGIGWTVLAGDPDAEVAQPFLQGRLLDFWLLLAACGIAGAAAWKVKGLLTGPLVALERGAEALGSGELHHRVEVASPAEFAALATTFNRMAEKLLHREEELRASEERFRRTFENAAVGIAHLTCEGIWLRVNARLLEILGYPETEVIGRPVGEFEHPEDPHVAARELEALSLGERRSCAFEKRFLRRDGSTVWAHLTLSADGESTGRPGFLVCVFQDVSERRRYEDALRESEERLRFATEGGRVAVWSFEPEEGVLRWRGELSESLGLGKRETLPYKEFWALIRPEDAPRVQAAMVEALEAGQEFEAEFRISLPTGQVRWLSSRGRRVEGRGRPVRVIGVFMDITRRKEEAFALEAAKLQAEAANRAKSDILARIMDACLAKPFKPDELASTLISWVAGGGEEVARAAAERRGERT